MSVILFGCENLSEVLREECLRVRNYSGGYLLLDKRSNCVMRIVIGLDCHFTKYCQYHQLFRVFDHPISVLLILFDLVSIIIF